MNKYLIEYIYFRKGEKTDGLSEVEANTAEKALFEFKKLNTAYYSIISIRPNYAKK